MPITTRNLDRVGDTQLLDLAEQTRSAWSERDEMIGRAQELLRQTWTVDVPQAWRQTAKTQHSSLPRRISARVLGTLTLRDPQYSRSPQDEDQQLTSDANQVERWLQGKFQYDKRTALPGKDAWKFLMGQLIDKGAICAGSIFAPHSWAGVPNFTDEGKIRREWWHDERGRKVDDAGDMDPAASARAYIKAVDHYRRIAKPPIIRRIIPPEQAYPLIVEGEMLALFLFRQASPIELGANGFVVEDEPGPDALLPLDQDARSLDHGILEVWTPHRARYYYRRKPLRHVAFGTEGLVHNYGFIPFTYRVGLEGGELEYGQYGMPLLGLVDSQLRMIDTLLTFQHNAIHLASFPSYQVRYSISREGVGTAMLVDARTGQTVKTYQFKSGTVMDFGPDKSVEPLLHPGLNKDFYEFLRFLMEEVNDLIPPTLSGIPASSGFNTVQSSVQAKAIINPIADAAELVLQDLAVMDLQHVAKRVPGPVYLNLEQRGGFSSRPKRVSRIQLDARMIHDYYDVSVFVDREFDRITLSGHLKNLGIVDNETILDAAGFEDPEEILMRTVRDRVFQDPQIDAALVERAIKRFGLKQLREEAVAMGRIQFGPDGTPLVQMPNGRLAGPGQPQAPEAQGPLGAMLGGQNLGALPGGPNPNSTNNPGINLPRQTPTGRPRTRRRGGALPGRPQLQNLRRPTPQNPAAP